LLKIAAMFGKLNDIEIDEFLAQEIVGRLGCYADDQVYIIPISYGFDGTYIYAHTGAGMKLQMMRKNPEVCFQVDNMNDLANWKSAIVWGSFEELTSEEDKEQALSALMRRNLPIITSETMQLTPQWPFADDPSNQVKGVFFRIRISKKSGRFEKRTEQYYFAS
jgi:uncharacterized protein